MSPTLHITSGDCAGDSLRESGVPGEVLVWHDVLYDGPRSPGWPDAAALVARAGFLADLTGGGMTREEILATLRGQYRRLEAAAGGDRIVLWFDACLFDQAMLAHLLTCLAHLGCSEAELLCVDAFPGVEPYHGLGQLTPAQLASLADRSRPVTEPQWRFAQQVDRAFARQDADLLGALGGLHGAPLPWVPAAAKRWLQETPDPDTGLGRLEQLALDAVRGGVEKPWRIFEAVAAADTPPQYWGDTTLWAKLNGLADREPPLVRIEGPARRLPRWQGGAALAGFRVLPV